MVPRFARLGAVSALIVSLWSSTASAALPCGTLLEHETWGGHTLARHVAKSRTFLQSRLDDEGIFAASTFASESSAVTVIAAALDSASDLDTWKVTRQGTARKVIKFKASAVTGKSLTQRHETTDPLSDVKGVTVVLQKAANKCKYRIVTAFPARL